MLGTIISIIIAWLLIMYAEYWLPVFLGMIAWGFVLLVVALLVGGGLLFLGELRYE